MSDTVTLTITPDVSGFVSAMGAATRRGAREDYLRWEYRLWSNVWRDVAGRMVTDEQVCAARARAMHTAYRAKTRRRNRRTR